MKIILVLIGLGVLILLSEIFRLRKALFPLVIVGILAALGMAVSYLWSGDGSLAPLFQGMADESHKIPTTIEEGKWYNRMMFFDGMGVWFSILILAAAFLWFLMSRNFDLKETSESDHLSLSVFAITGAVILAGYANMAMLFLGVEILSIPVYVLAGSNKSSLSSNESAFKYFIMGSFASAVLLFGIALVYGATGSFDIQMIQNRVMAGAIVSPAMLYTGVVFMLCAMLFKLSAAPFHFWAPDVYQGAPTGVTAFMATIVKTAAIAATVRLFAGNDMSIFSSEGHVLSTWAPVLVWATVLTIVVGNVTAVVQSNVKRMLAYSGIAHAGIMLLALSSSVHASGTVFFYSAAYTIASLAAFAVVGAVAGDDENQGFDRFNGMIKRSPLLAVSLAVAMLSLAGIPPTAGFIAKYMVFSTSMGDGNTWLVVLAIIGSLVGIYYYMKLVIHMFFKPADSNEPVKVPELLIAFLVFSVVLTLALGIMPDMLLEAAF
jgi:NADH-quinone oxidoreductase subunit N